MTIHNMEKFVQSIWDWSFLNQCFASTGIKVSDIDGIVERRGWFLLIEAKNPGVPIPLAQQIMQSKLVKSRFTCVTLWGKSNQPERMRVWLQGTPTPNDIVDCTEKDVIDFVSAWFSWCENEGYKNQID